MVELLIPLDLLATGCTGHYPIEAVTRSENQHVIVCMYVCTGMCVQDVTRIYERMHLLSVILAE